MAVALEETPSRKKCDLNSMDQWPSHTVLELQHKGVLRVEDGNHGEYRPRPNEFVEDGVAFIRAADMDAGSILFEQCEKINKTARERITKGIGAPNDSILSHKGTVGKVALAASDAPPFVCSPQTTFWRSLNVEVLDPIYLYVFLRSPLFQQALRTIGGETDMAPYASLTSQRSLKVLLPPINIQRRIASLVGGLDARIDLLRKMNETLEAMARAIFKSWFVDFDPVRAKAEGREPEGMDTATAALFPSEFQDSELGPIPQGWNIGRLEDLFVLQRGFDLPNSQRVDGEFPVIAASGPSGTHSEFKVKGPGVVTGRSGVLGNVFYVHDDFWPLNTSLWIKEFRSAPPLYSYRVLQRMDLRMFNAGSAVPTLNRNHLHGLPTLLPPKNVLDWFDGLVSPLHQRMRITEKQIVTLATLRDTLLPRLISGKLRVPEAEAMLAEAL